MSQLHEFVQLDWDAFDPCSIAPVRHRLVDHPVRRADALAELGQRLDERGSVRAHGAAATAVTPVNDAPRRHPNRAGVWEPRDAEAASARARDRFHASQRRALLHRDGSLRAWARLFHLEPGQGAPMPSTSAHMVENGDEPSPTVGFTCYTAITRRNSLPHRSHERLRGIAVEPPAAGENALPDVSLLAALHTVTHLRHGNSRLDPGRQQRPGDAPSAYAAMQ